jgi:uncharacterized membrane protein
MVALPVVLAALLVALAAGVALYFRPFAVLREPALRGPWVAVLVLVPAAWAVPSVIAGGSSLRLSFACLLVLMFGWPLAVWTLLAIAVIASAATGFDAITALETAAWNGVLPATLALGVGITVRRVLPPHVFVFILGRGFLGTAVAIMAAGAVGALSRPLPAGMTMSTLLVAQWLMAWGEAVITGMCVAIFVAFKPQWLLTWSDQRYLRPPAAK